VCEGWGRGMSGRQEILSFLSSSVERIEERMGRLIGGRHSGQMGPDSQVGDLARSHSQLLASPPVRLSGLSRQRTAGQPDSRLTGDRHDRSSGRQQ
jgi:hypothetical protein